MPKQTRPSFAKTRSYPENARFRRVLERTPKVSAICATLDMRQNGVTPKTRVSARKLLFFSQQNPTHINALLPKTRVLRSHMGYFAVPNFLREFARSSIFHPPPEPPS